MKSDPARLKKLAAALNEGIPVCAALEQAGWSESQAKKGFQKVPQAVFGMLNTPTRKRIENLINLGKSFTPEDQENLVRGRLADNVVKGSDRGVMSAKALGSDKRVSMFTPEFQQGIIVLQPPNMTAEQMQKALEAPDE